METTAIVQVVQIAATAIGSCVGTYALLFDKVLRQMDEFDRTAATIKANQEEAKRKMEQDLERWSDGLAASYGEELEEITDRLMDMAGKVSNGEDIMGDLYGIHADLCMIMADMYTIGYSEDE